MRAQEFQPTLPGPAIFAGVGVHTGAYTRVAVRPAPTNSGIVFVRTDLTDRDNRVPATGEAVTSAARMMASPSFSRS